MSLAPAPSPPVWLCARCGYKPFTGGIASRAKHLIDEHGVPAMAALAEARGEAEAPPATAVDVLTTLLGPENPAVVNEINRGASPTPTKETPMPTGVYPRTSDPTTLCGRCKRPKTDHTAACPRRPGATTMKPKPAITKRPGRPKKVALAPRVAPTNGADPIVTIRGALDQLEAELTSIRALKAAMAKALNA